MGTPLMGRDGGGGGGGGGGILRPFAFPGGNLHLMAGKSSVPNTFSARTVGF